MTKKDKREKTRAERERIRLKKQLERDEQMLAADDSLETELPPIEDEEDDEEDFTHDGGPGVVKKEMGEPMAGPTSWDELDAQKEANAKAAVVRDVTWNVQDLVSNILYSALSPDEKSKAIQSVGDGFGKRVKSVLGETVKKSIDDMDILETEALLARDFRSMSVVEKAKNAFSKLLGSESEKSKLRRELQIAVKSLKAGDESARATLSTLRTDAKKAGIGAVDQSRSAVIVEKDAKGSWRAVMWPSNNFQDHDGDIISASAHQEYVEWVNKNMEHAPIFLSWHTPETVRKNRVDFVSYENGFLLMSAPLEQDEAAALLKAQTLTDLGMSHGSFAIRNSDDRRIIEKYRMFEVSDLPLENAANPFTDFDTLTKEASMDQKKYLATILGSEEAANAFFEKAEMKQQALRKAGVEEKGKSDSAEGTQETVETQTDTSGTNLELSAVLEAVNKELDIPGLNAFLAEAKEAMDKVPVLEQLVKHLSAESDEKVADKIAARKPADYVWKSRASANEDNVLSEADADKALKKAMPGVSDDYWLSQVSGTEPVAAATP